MGKWLTVSERKAQSVERIRIGAEVLREKLRTYAKEYGGKFLLFGSVARGDYKFSSDVDIVVDFPPRTELSAQLFAEATCAEIGLAHDITLKRYCDETFLKHIEKDMEIIHG